MAMRQVIKIWIVVRLCPLLNPEVGGEERKRPYIQYSTKKEAIVEAKRLAIANPGIVFSIQGTEEAYYSEPMMYACEITE